MDDPVIAEALQDIFATDLFRVYTNPDVIGCEVAGALKNVMAIASGMADGLGTGDNTRSAVITRGLAELTRLGCAMGGQQVTFAGLAGMGDLIATCISPQSRNRYVGEQLGRGRTIDEIIDEMNMVAEGVKTSKVVMELAHEYGVAMPIAREVHRVVHEGGTGRRRLPRPARPARRARRDARHAQLLIRWRACASGPVLRASRGTTGCRPAARAAGRPSATSTRRRGPRSTPPAWSRSPDAGWSLDWWIGAEDRWHVPAREAAVRQALVGNSPVVETRLRVPSGDAVQRAYAGRGHRRRRGARRRGAQRHEGAVRRGAGRAALRPRRRRGASVAIELDGPLVRVDGAAGARCCRAHRAGWRSRMPTGDAAAVVFAGDAEPVRPAEVRCADGLANGALLFPLAHTATLRVAIPLPAADGTPLDPPPCPSADQVAAGWAVQARAGRPHRGAQPPAARRGRGQHPASCSSAVPDPAVAAALDLLGFPDEAARRLLADGPRGAGPTLRRHRAGTGR